MANEFKDMLGREGASVSDRELGRLEELFRSIADSIATARSLMTAMPEQTHAPLLGRAKRKGDAAENLQLSLDEDQADVEVALAALFQGISPTEFDDHLRERLIHYFDIDGWVAAGVFACLLRHPGQYIAHDSMAKAVGVQSTSSRVIRVYVCQLRASIEARGMSGDSIETGRGSYRIVRSAAFEIINAIASN